MVVRGGGVRAELVKRSEIGVFLMFLTEMRTVSSGRQEPRVKYWSFLVIGEILDGLR